MQTDNLIPITRRRALTLGALTLLGLGSFDYPAMGQEPRTQVTGYWTSIDDDGKTPKAVIQIEQKGSSLTGKIVKLINPEEKDPKCAKCEGANHNRPILGLQILWGLTRDGDEWSGGKVLDPNNGSVYDCLVEVVDNGSRLKVRGYIGVSLLGRTQYWRRAKGPEG